ncbi:hypothetical protein K2X33_12910 [bacterium]|nr:hypothetical protein [bacterium]
MKLKIAFLLACLVCPAFGAAGSILQSTRRLRMSSIEPLPVKDFYVDLGVRDGVRVGDVFTVRRPVSVTNGQSDANVHLVLVPMGELRVLAVGETVCITRPENTIDSSLLPAFQYAGFMVGDEVLTKSHLPAGLAIP